MTHATYFTDQSSGIRIADIWHPTISKGRMSNNPILICRIFLDVYTLSFFICQALNSLGAKLYCYSYLDTSLLNIESPRVAKAPFSLPFVRYGSRFGGCRSTISSTYERYGYYHPEIIRCVKGFGR